MGRLIDSYAEGVISKAEFEPRLAGLRQRVAKLETEAAALQDTAEQARSLQLVIGKLEVFAALVRDRLEDADWDTRRDVIRTLVRRIEIDGQHVRVVFRVDPGPQDGTGAFRVGQRCLGRDRGVGGRAADDPGWAVLVFAAGHPDGAHATRVVPPGLPASRGLLGSVVSLLGLSLQVPDHTTLSRRAATLDVPRPGTASAGADGDPLHLLEKHGTATRQSWRALHLGVDAGTGRIVVATLTSKDLDDASQAGPLARSSRGHGSLVQR